MSEKEFLKIAAETIVNKDAAGLDQVFKEAKSTGLSQDALLAAMTKGLDAVRLRLRDHSVSIPEFLLSVDVLRRGLNKLKLLKSPKKSSGKPVTIVIGVVEGDVHDLGKNIVTGVLQAYGYHVIDLGKDVSADRFLEKVKESRAAILALSTMMSTPLEHMRETVVRCKRELPEVAVIVGGAVLDQTIADNFGADGYAESAVTLPEEVRRIRGTSSISNLIEKG
jgi:methanogenic corrinoid protein MtbC1